MAEKEVKFVAVARRSDKVILASRIHTADKSYDFVSNVNKVLSSPGWASVTTDKLSLDDGPNMFYVLIDEAGRVFVAITSKGYPSRFIYGSTDGQTRGILQELKKGTVERFGDQSLSVAAGGLQSKAASFLKGLCDEFNDLNSIDKVASVQAKVNSVTRVMQSNIEAAIKNTDRIEDIDEKAVVLAEGASRFNKASQQLKRSMRCRYWKMILLFTVLIIAVLCAIIIPLVLQAQKK